MGAKVIPSCLECTFFKGKLPVYKGKLIYSAFGEITCKLGHMGKYGLYEQPFLSSYKQRFRRYAEECANYDGEDQEMQVPVQRDGQQEGSLQPA